MQVAGLLFIQEISLFILEHVPSAKQTLKCISKYGSHSEVQAVTSRSVRSSTQDTFIYEISQQQYWPFLISALYRFWKCCTSTPSTHSLLATYTNRYNASNLNVTSVLENAIVQSKLTLITIGSDNNTKSLFMTISVSKESVLTGL